MSFLYYLPLIIVPVAVIFLMASWNLKTRRKIFDLTEDCSQNQHRLAEFRKGTQASLSPELEPEKIAIDKFLKITAEMFHPDSSLIYLHRKNGKTETIEMLRCEGVPGTVFESTWTSKDRDEVRNNLEKSFIFSSRPHMLSHSEIPENIPSGFPFRPAHALLSVAKMENCAYYILLLRKEGKGEFNDAECTFIDFWSCFLERELLYISAMKEKDSISDELEKAHEEGMVQISSGIIHNIGNGLTVLQMQMEKLKEHNQIRELAGFIASEIIPSLSSHVDDNTIGEFLSKDPMGKRYLQILKEASVQLAELSGKMEKDVADSVSKFANILEIINLQQKFIGELGTENVISASEVVREALEMSKLALGQNKILLQENLESQARLLIDTAILKHIVLLNMKYSMESINKTQRSPPIVEVKLSDVEENTKRWVELLISDNGYGIDLESVTGDSQMARDLKYCADRVRKYGGSYSVKFKHGQGSEMSIRLPAYQEKTGK